MESSPFPYQGPLPPDQVVGRDAIVADLLERVSERRVTALLGPRRFGKTSLLRKLERELVDTVDVIWVDLYGALTAGDLAAAFARGLDAGTGAAARRARQISATLGVSLGVVRAELTARPARRPDERQLWQLCLDVLERVATSTETVLVVDEFQAIRAVDGAAEQLRTVLQHRYRDMGLVFAGSRPSMLRNLFASPDQPFYDQADLIEIGPLDGSTVHELVTHGFATTGRDAGPLPPRIHQLTRGHPQRTMWVADWCWRAVGSGGTATTRTWEETLPKIREAAAARLAGQFDLLAGTEQKVLRVLASDGALFGAAGQRLGLSSGAATGARGRLVADGLLTEDAEIVDPLLADWLARELPA